jgi:aminoglycoside 6'-N-acetyltransferase I
VPVNWRGDELIAKARKCSNGCFGQSLRNSRYGEDAPRPAVAYDGRMATSPLKIRQAEPGDRTALAHARAALWPDTSFEEHSAEVADLLNGRQASTLPQDTFVAESASGEVIGFVDVGLRSHADGCDTRQPVAFVEGWYVAPDHRRIGVGRALIATAEAWGRAHGCVEMASDTWIDHDMSQRAHEALGFTVVDRCVHYRKTLR